MLDITVRHSGNAINVVLHIYGCTHDLGLMTHEEAQYVADAFRAAERQIRGYE